MSTININNTISDKLFQTIIKKEGKKNFSKVISSTLSISIDSAYRRLQGKIDLSFNEAIILAKKYKISLDSLIHDNIEQIIFNYNPNYKDNSSFEQYLSEINEMLLNLKNNNGHLTYLVHSLPLSQIYKNRLLRKFKDYYWNKVTWDNKKLINVSFEEFESNENEDKIIEELITNYDTINRTEIWSQEVLHTTLRQISYCISAGYFKNNNSILELKNMLLALLANLKDELIQAKESEGKPCIQFYACSVDIGDNYILMKDEHQKTSFLNFTLFNTLSTQKESFGEELDNYIQNLKSKSVPLTGQSDVLRHQYFEKLRIRVEDTITI